MKAHGCLPASKELHSQEGKDDDEEEEEEEQTDDGLHGTHQGDHQIPQGGPVPTKPRRHYSGKYRKPNCPQVQLDIGLVVYEMSCLV